MTFLNTQEVADKLGHGQGHGHGHGPNRETEAGVSERPILFNGEMVRAILEGRKTQTRRVIKLCHEGYPYYQIWKHLSGDGFGYATESRDGHFYKGAIRCPCGKPGDRLWVRETWYCDHFLELGTVEDWKKELYYRADVPSGRFEDAGYWAEPGPSSWKPSIHMPRWASRITLEITDIRVERVQDITYRDCEAEGLEHPGRGIWTVPGTDETFREGYLGFKYLWDSINAKRGFGWNVNPWVWVVEFKKLNPKNNKGDQNG